VTKRPADKTLDRIGLVLLGCGLLLVIVVSWLRMSSRGLEIGLVAVGFVLAVSGLYLNRRFREKEE
jgi:hypothetical protein